MSPIAQSSRDRCGGIASGGATERCDRFTAHGHGASGAPRGQPRSDDRRRARGPRRRGVLAAGPAARPSTTCTARENRGRRAPDCSCRRGRSGHGSPTTTPACCCRAWRRSGSTSSGFAAMRCPSVVPPGVEGIGAGVLPAESVIRTATGRREDLTGRQAVACLSPCAPFIPLHGGVSCQRNYRG
jgi:hypothetical protein